MLICFSLSFNTFSRNNFFLLFCGLFTKEQGHSKMRQKKIKLDQSEGKVSLLHDVRQFPLKGIKNVKHRAITKIAT